MVKGYFIVFDGLDGSGKSKMVRLFNKYFSLSNDEYNILETREPTDGKFGTEVRDILSRDEDPQLNAERLLELLIKDREEHLKKTIIPFIDRNDENKKNIVLCDRYYYSTIAFQSTQGLDIKMLLEKNVMFLKPDIAFIMDIKPETALARIKHRKKEKFENLEFMNKLRNTFLNMPDLLNDNIKIIDASKDLNEVFEDIKKEINNIL